MVQSTLYSYDYVWGEYAQTAMRGEHGRQGNNHLQIIAMQAEFECCKAVRVRGEHRCSGVADEGSRPENMGPYLLLFAR